MSTSHEHDHEDDAEPVTERMHGNSWSANLELPQHAADIDLVKAQAVDAIEHTESGHHVNLVTHGDHGHPADYLHDVLEDRFGTDDLTWGYVQQCGCGGHVTRVHVE